MAAEVVAGLPPHYRPQVVLAIDWSLPEIAALFAASSFYVGNDTGVMNMAAAVGIRTYALFGATPPFTHASAIVAITLPVLTGCCATTVSPSSDSDVISATRPTPSFAATRGDRSRPWAEAVKTA